MVRIYRKLDSDTLHLPELKPLIGKTVEIIVVEEASAAVQPERTHVSAAKEGRGAEDPGCFRDLLPPKPPDDEEKIALRALLTAEQFEALIDIANRGGPDINAIARLRAKSMI